jgi:hypothetical protein
MVSGSGFVTGKYLTWILASRKTENVNREDKNLDPEHLKKPSRVNVSQKKAGLWIRIGSGFSDFVDPDPYWDSGSRIRIQGQENEEISVEKCTF